jgi:hypothetical protein
MKKPQTKARCTARIREKKYLAVGIYALNDYEGSYTEADVVEFKCIPDKLDWELRQPYYDRTRRDLTFEEILAEVIVLGQGLKVEKRIKLNPLKYRLDVRLKHRRKDQLKKEELFSRTPRTPHG